MDLYYKRVDAFYEIDWTTGLIGRGGFAEVFLGKCMKSGQFYAIKRINKHQIRTAKMEKRVCEEVQIHSRLKHPSILELHEFFEDENYVYLVLEYAENGELQNFLKTYKKRFNETDAAKILKQVVEGLLYLHTHNIMHRDISLSNLLLTRDMKVKIADFGLATQFSPRLDNHMTLCGTPNFISPEVASRSAHGPLTDVWGIGCILYTLLVGKPPFDTDGIKTTLAKVMQGDYMIPSFLSSEAKNLIENLLRTNPKERISLQDVLYHPFVTKSLYKNNTQISSDSGILTMSSSNRFQGGSFIDLPLSGFNDKTEMNANRNNIDPVPDLMLSGLNSQTSNQNFCQENKLFEGHMFDTQKASSLNVSAMNERLKTPLTDKRIASLQNLPSFPFLTPPTYTSTPQDVLSQQQSKILQKLSVPPLNTTRLLPTRHKTSKMILTVLDDGAVVVELIKFFTRLDECRIVEILQISGDGMQIMWYQPTNKLGEAILDKPAEIPNGQGVSFTYHNLPSKHHKKYIYGYKFVQMVKAKTPKITYFSTRAKFQVMETLEDFESFFYNDVKIFKTSLDGTRIYNQGNLVAEDNMTSTLRDDWNHFQNCIQHCLNLNQVLSSINTAHACFPITVGRRPLTNSQNISMPKTTQSSSSSLPILSELNPYNCKSKAETVVRKILLPNIGTVLQLNNGSVEVHYYDGSTLSLLPQNPDSGISYSQGNSRNQIHYSSTDVIPQQIRNKLNQMPFIINQLKSTPSLIYNKNQSNRSHVRI